MPVHLWTYIYCNDSAIHGKVIAGVLSGFFQLEEAVRCFSDNFDGEFQLTFVALKPLKILLEINLSF